MKLAEEWIENATAAGLSPLPPFHDEVKEAKDGCGGVPWQKYVLIEAQSSNKQLHELAREIRGAEKRLGKKLTGTQYKGIFDKWEAASQPFLRPGNDYFTELLAKLDCVTIPKGETLAAAFERAKANPPPAKVLINRNAQVRLLAALCRELQEMSADQPFMLCQLSVAKLFGHTSHRTVCNWIKALKALDILKVAEPWGWGKATRYFYIP